ncbi:MAG: response regulator [Candidatus Omnitrophica bacterium]|nr:response regulator [Candidatus Omnitrophota bacterium]
MKKVLIIEDDKDIVEMIKYNLEKEQYAVLASFTGKQGFSSAKKDRPDIVLLDLMLPDIDGFEVCRLLKNNELTRCIPLIMLTAKSREADKVAGLELGADDYLTKPFSPRELSARIKAVLRRADSPKLSQKTARGILLVDSVKHKVYVRDKEVLLTHTEFKILEFMIQRPGVVITRNKLLDNIFGYDSESYDRTIDAHIKSIRKKLKTARNYIETVRGAGYRLKEE